MACRATTARATKQQQQPGWRVGGVRRPDRKGSPAIKEWRVLTDRVQSIKTLVVVVTSWAEDASPAVAYLPYAPPIRHCSPVLPKVIGRDSGCGYVGRKGQAGEGCAREVKGGQGAREARARVTWPTVRCTPCHRCPVLLNGVDGVSWWDIVYVQQSLRTQCRFPARTHADAGRHRASVHVSAPSHVTTMPRPE